MKIRKAKPKPAVVPKPVTGMETRNAQEWDAFFETWLATHRENRVNSSVLLEIVRSLGVPARVATKPTERAQLTALGIGLNKRDTYKEFRVRKLGKAGVFWYCLEACAQDAAQ